MSKAGAVYGLEIQATHSVPGLAASAITGQVDVKVKLGGMPSWLQGALDAAQSWHIKPRQNDPGEPVLRVWELAGGDYFRMLYADDTQFVVDRLGTEVWATWPDTLTLEDTATYLLGPVLGFILRLRGVTCLHASAVAVGNQAIAILGPAGAGKSTAAAAFAQAGYKVLTDDIVALDERGDAFLVQPAYPRVRLWGESVNALFGAEDALPRLTPTWDKRYLDLQANASRFQEHPLPLAAIYLLGERISDPAAPFIEAVPASESLMTLVANTYANHLLDKAMRAAEFKSLSRLCERVPIRRVTPHEDIAQLSNLCEGILSDFRTRVC